MHNKCKVYNSCEIFNSVKNYDAYAVIKGGPLAPNISGKILLQQIKDGVYLHVYISGIPAISNNDTPIEFHGLHIHEFGNCTIGDPENPFLSAGGHWNPANLNHPNHAGDLPPILSNNGVAMMSFFTNRFYLKDAIGRSFILHEKPDDFISQPTGNAGKRLACGTIKLVNPCCCK